MLRLQDITKQIIIRSKFIRRIFLCYIIMPGGCAGNQKKNGSKNNRNPDRQEKISHRAKLPNNSVKNFLLSGTGLSPRSITVLLTCNTV